MRIEVNQINTINRVNNNNIKRNVITFGAVNDEFIKTQTGKTYAQAVTEIQKKFQPQLSELRKKRTEVANTARQKVLKLFEDRNTPSVFSEFGK